MFAFKAIKHPLKSILFFLAVIFLAICYYPNVEAASRSRAIHVVYDDSGTMFRTRDERGNLVYNDRWGQQRYALEVLIAKLEESDVMRLYYLSHFDLSVAGGNLNAPHGVEIHGRDPAAVRLAQKREVVTFSANTPFEPVIRAYNDLLVSGADDKWLIIISDGLYNRLDGVRNNNIDVNGMLAQFAGESDVSIFFLAVGEDDEIDEMIASLNPNPDIGYFFYHARSSHEILSKITHMGNIIFNRNVLPFTNDARHEFTFDVPVSELIVFAQGANVSINGIRGDASISPCEAVSVRYSDVPASNAHLRNNPNVIISRELSGVVATFSNVPMGSYYLDITGAQTVEIYFQPLVGVDIRLFQDGEQIPLGSIMEGEYQVRFGIINEDGDFFESALLGTIVYNATLENNGRVIPINSGDFITLEQGSFEISVQAHFLEINTASNAIRGPVMAAVDPYDAGMASVVRHLAELRTDGPLILTVTSNDQPLEQHVWANMPIPIVTTDDNVIITEGRRGREVSTFEFYLRPAAVGDTATGYITLTVNSVYYDGHLWVRTSNHLVYISTPDITVTITNPNQNMIVSNLNDTEALTVTVLQDGRPLTEAEWQNMSLPEVTSRDNIEITDIRRGQEVSTFQFYITHRNNDRFATARGNVTINVQAEIIVEGLSFTGEASEMVYIYDDISRLDRIINFLYNNWRLLLGLLLLFLILLGYVPPFKKYLPKRLVRRPEVTRREGRKMRPSTTGRYNKKLWSTLLPWVNERGTIQFTPKGVMSPLEVCGAGKKRMEITNLRRFAGNKNFMFKGDPIEKDVTKQSLKRMSVTQPSISLTAIKNGITYECNPTIK